MGDIEKKKNSPVRVWEDSVEDILFQNVYLQKKALERVEETIESANALQAATIYGILHDKCQSIVAPKMGETGTFNMYIGNDIPDDRIAGIMERVVERTKQTSQEEPVVLEVVSESEGDAED